MENSSITSGAERADGGNIKINTDNLVRLVGSEITASVGGGPETVGGNINIDPEFVILEDSAIIANAFEGRGGNIQIVAGTFLADPSSIVDASSAKGIDGTVEIRAPVSDVSQKLKPSEKSFLRAAVLIREPCIARLRGGEYSSFVIEGRNGLPLEPGGLLPSPLRLD
jgi:large exoprotein involved in heme utilization and adhesion